MKVRIKGTEFEVPDEKLELLRMLLFEVCTGASNEPPRPSEEGHHD